MIRLVDKNIFSSMKKSILDDKFLGSLLIAFFKIGAESGNPQWAQSNYSYHKISYLLYANDFSDEDIFYIAKAIDKVSLNKICLTTKMFHNDHERAPLLTIGGHYYCDHIELPDDIDVPDLLPSGALLDRTRYLDNSDFSTRCGILVRSLKNLGYSDFLEYADWNHHRPKIREYISSFKERNGM